MEVDLRLSGCLMAHQIPADIALHSLQTGRGAVIGAESLAPGLVPEGRSAIRYTRNTETAVMGGAINVCTAAKDLLMTTMSPLYPVLALCHRHPCLLCLPHLGSLPVSC